MEIGNIFSKLKDEKIGMALGALLTAKSVSWTGGITGYYSTLLNGIMTDPHFPDLGHVVNALTQLDESKVFKPAVLAAILGYFMKEIDIVPMVGQLGELLQKLGIGAAMGSAAQTVVWYSTVAHSPGASGPGNSSGLNMIMLGE